MPTLDTLEISKRLKGAGFTELQAEAMTGVLRDAHEAEIAELATKTDLGRVEAALKTDLGRVEAALRADMTSLRAEMEILRRDLTIRLGGMIVVATGILLAAKFFG
ncbi:MAG: DUF1640 domain-containing protein [Alphaproteobacteria bacterium]|nr:DUF1640 domain-containing protein [Alphaproteobacteria bacterium]